MRSCETEWSIREKLRRLPISIEPPGKVWPGIRRRMNHPSMADAVRSRKRARTASAPIAIAAALAVVIGGVILLSRPELFRNGSTGATQTAIDRGMRNAAGEYRSAREELMEAFERIERIYGDGIFASVERRFEELDDEIASALALLPSEEGEAVGRLLGLYGAGRHMVAFTHELMATFDF